VKAAPQLERGEDAQGLGEAEAGVAGERDRGGLRERE
jgi:hypothetical protein